MQTLSKSILKSNFCFGILIRLCGVIATAGRSFAASENVKLAFTSNKCSSDAFPGKCATVKSLHVRCAGITLRTLPVPWIRDFRCSYLLICSSFWLKQHGVCTRFIGNFCSRMFLSLFNYFFLKKVGRSFVLDGWVRHTPS